MICPKCNKEIEENSKFCPFCGEATTEEVVLTNETMEAASEVVSANPAKDNNSIFKSTSIVAFLISTFFVIIGFCKMLIYSNGEYYPYKSQNAYVGGDAYNYIINSNYATAFFVLAVLFTIIGFGLLTIHYIKKNDCRISKCMTEKSEEGVGDNNASMQ